MSDQHETAVAVIQRHDVERMHPVVRAMLEQGPDPSTLRELLAVQREWESGEAQRAYTSSLVALKRDMPAVIAKDSTVDYTGGKGRVHYTHASLAGAMAAITAPLTSHGFSLNWEPATPSPNLVTVTCRLTHADGHSESCTISAPPDTSGNKSTAQGVASTITLLQRYTALSLLGIATADMQEPAAEPDPERVDSARNLKAVAALRKYGKTVAQAEDHLKRPMTAWTTADLDELRRWLQSEPKPAEPAAAPPAEAIAMDARLAKAATACGYDDWQVTAILDELGGDVEKALAHLRKEYKAKKAATS